MQSLNVPKTVSVRDFAYQHDHPLHYGVTYAQEHSLLPETDQIPWESQNEEIDEDQDILGEPEYDYNSDSIQGKAIALFDFVPENDNEFELKEGQVIWINYRHGQGWLVAARYEDAENEDGTFGVIDNELSGLVPEEYVQLLE